jgi:hypothetical protein
MSKTIYHQGLGGSIHKGRKQDCKACLPKQGRPETVPTTHKPRYTYEEAAELIDRCAGCGKPIPEDHPWHHCAVCLPAWQKRIAEINSKQDRDWEDFEDVY